MGKDRHGKQWTKDEDRQLKELFDRRYSFIEMAQKLGRTWFSCKCRLARLGLIEPFERNAEEFYIGHPEKYRVPNPDVNRIYGMFEELNNLCFVDEIEEDTSNTFSNAELNIVTDWLKTRLTRVVCKLADGEHCFIRNVELNTVKELLETEIQVANNMKKMSVEEREKVCRRLC